MKLEPLLLKKSYKIVSNMVAKVLNEVCPYLARSLILVFLALSVLLMIFNVQLLRFT